MRFLTWILSARSNERNYSRQIRKSTLMRAKTETKKTTDAVAILDQMAGDSPELRRLTEEARINAAVAQLIYAARNKAGLVAGCINELGDSRIDPRLLGEPPQFGTVPSHLIQNGHGISRLFCFSFRSHKCALSDLPRIISFV